MPDALLVIQPTASEYFINPLKKDESVSRVLCPTRHIIGHFGNKSFQAITCTGTDNSKQTKRKYIKNTKKHKMHKLALGKKNTKPLNENLYSPKSD